VERTTIAGETEELGENLPSATQFFTMIRMKVKDGGMDSKYTE
jgi:hypothetical protein